MSDAKQIAYLDWSLDVKCQNCKEDIDLVLYDSENDYGISKRIFNNAWDQLQGWRIECPHCANEFSIEKVVY